jgi:hypothetical protein
VLEVEIVIELVDARRIGKAKCSVPKRVSSVSGAAMPGGIGVVEYL